LGLGTRSAVSQRFRTLRKRALRLVICQRPWSRFAIVSAQHLVIVFPLWHRMMPALLKAFLEQAVRQGVAFEYRKARLYAGAAWGAVGALVVTMGMPALIYRWYFRAHGVRGFERSVLRFAGTAPVREALLGMADAASERLRQAPHLNLAQHANEPIAMLNS
jgi:putative NADPH-quinone reductase